AGLVASIAHCIADEIVENLNELAAVAPHSRQRVGHYDSEFARPTCGGMGEVQYGRRDNLADVYLFARQDKAVGLNARKAHQILDDAQHPARLIADRPAEIRA